MVTNEAGDKGVSASSLALCADGSQSPGIRLGKITMELIRIYAGPVAYRDIYGCGERQHIHNDHRIALGDQFRGGGLQFPTRTECHTRLDRITPWA